MLAAAAANAALGIPPPGNSRRPVATAPATPPRVAAAIRAPMPRWSSGTDRAAARANSGNPAPIRHVGTSKRATPTARRPSRKGQRVASIAEGRTTAANAGRWSRPRDHSGPMTASASSMPTTARAGLLSRSARRPPMAVPVPRPIMKAVSTAATAYWELPKVRASWRPHSNSRASAANPEAKADKTRRPRPGGT